MPCYTFRENKPKFQLCPGMAHAVHIVGLWWEDFSCGKIIGKLIVSVHVDGVVPRKKGAFGEAGSSYESGGLFSITQMCMYRAL